MPALEVGPIPLEAAAIAGALELVLGAEPVRRAAEVGADRQQGIKAAVILSDNNQTVASRLGTSPPCAPLVFFSSVIELSRPKTESLAPRTVCCAPLVIRTDG